MRSESAAPRMGRGATKKGGRKGYQSESPDPFPSQDSCLGPGCGACYVTVVGDKRWCEVEAINKLRRELAAAIEGAGSR